MNKQIKQINQNRSEIKLTNELTDCFSEFLNSSLVSWALKTDLWPSPLSGSLPEMLVTNFCPPVFVYQLYASVSSTHRNVVYYLILESLAASSIFKVSLHFLATSLSSWKLVLITFLREFYMDKYYTRSQDVGRKTFQEAGSQTYKITNMSWCI